MFQGSIVALVTPMHADGSIDQQALAGLIEWHVHAHSQALVIAGTTGEAATLNEEEHYALIAFAVKQAAGRIPIIAGTGSHSTQKTIQLSLSAQKAGAQACIIVTPYYNKPTQNGLYQHYKMVAEQLSLPIILYNVPSRTSCDLLPATVERLAELPSIIGIKEATGKLERAIDLRQRCPSHFCIYSGDDATALEWILHGAQGVISVTANIAPAQMQQLCQHALNKNKQHAEKINQALEGLHHSLFLETNPIPVKWALEQMGLIAAGIRLPLTPLDQRYHQAIKTAMQQAGVTLND